MTKRPRKLLSAILIVIVAFILIQVTTLGWRPTFCKPIQLSPQEEESARRLEATVEYLSARIGNRNFMDYQNLNAAADYINQTFHELGYEVEIMPYEIKGQIFKNIIAQKAYRGESQKTIVIGAHYDSCFNPGADDNASGIAGLLELARLLREEKSKYTVKFIAFTNEEPPFIMTENMGSWVYTKAARQKGENIHVALILEMIGYYSNEKFSQRYLPLLGFFYPNRGDFIAIVGSMNSRRITAKIARSLRQKSKFPTETLIVPSFLPRTNWSDHWSFWKEGYSAVMITDTAFLRNPHYHMLTDLPQSLDYKKMTKLIYALRTAIIDMQSSL